MPALNAAIGNGQKNNPEDVNLVRGLLNELIKSGKLSNTQQLASIGPWDNSVATALKAVGEQYFYGVADPNNKLETDDDLFQFLLNPPAEESPQTGQRLSAQTYGLASTMVPGGIRRVHVKANKAAGTEKKTVTIDNINSYLPLILKELKKAGINDTDMLMMALGSIRAESSQFTPISEGVSKYNTSAIGTKDRHPFDLYDFRNEGTLGNNANGMGELYKGRGFIQLTGRFNYSKYGGKIGIDLVSDPERANDPEIAAAILAAFLKENKTKIRNALQTNNLALARRCVNGGAHGKEEFVAAFAAGRRFLEKNN